METGPPDGAVEALLAGFETSWNAYDADGIAALFADDAEVTDSFGISAYGRPAIARPRPGVMWAGVQRARASRVPRTRVVR